MAALTPEEMATLAAAQKQAVERKNQHKQSSRPGLSAAAQPLTMTLKIIMSNDPAADDYNPPSPLTCEYCGRERYTKGIIIGSKVTWLPCGPEPCTCPEGIKAAEKAAADQLAEIAKREITAAAAKQQAKISAVIGAYGCGLGKRFIHRRFDNFISTDENKAALATAIGYVANFKNIQEQNETRERNGLLLIGPPGTGKTHLAAAIANDLTSSGTCVLFSTMIDALDKIKRSYKADNAGSLSEFEIIRTYKTTDLLIIDDLGKERPTEWALEKIYSILNARYENYRAIIVTTNYTAPQLIARMTPTDGDRTTAEATVDRIREMTWPVMIGGASWRLKE